MDKNDRIEHLKVLLTALDAEREKLAQELASLIRRSHDQTIVPLGKRTQETTPASSDEKIELFITLFRCREDVYPRRWEDRTKQRAGYSPVCQNEWDRDLCDKRKVKCSECPSRRFMPFTKDTAKGHLEGKFVVGSYAIRTDDTCTFLAADFDGSHWKEDVAAYKESARTLGIDVGVERSRSGNGAHAWIFFIEPTPARDARNLGMIILSKAMRSRHELPLTSYDRFFPSQDTMPSGGFGNLIALPLQQEARKNGNTAFLDDSFKDQQMAIISLPTRSAVRYVPLRQIVAFVLRHFVAS